MQSPVMSLQTTNGTKAAAMTAVGDKSTASIDVATREAASHATVCIELTTTSGERRRLFLREVDTVVLGRKSKGAARHDNEPYTQYLRFDYPVVSRSHAQLIPADGEVCLVDCDSLHGTYLNGDRLQGTDEGILRDGDVIQLGVDIERGDQTHKALRLTYARLPDPQIAASAAPSVAYAYYSDVEEEEDDDLLAEEEDDGLVEEEDDDLVAEEEDDDLVAEKRKDGSEDKLDDDFGDDYRETDSDAWLDDEDLVSDFSGDMSDKENASSALTTPEQVKSGAVPWEKLHKRKGHHITFADDDPTEEVVAVLKPRQEKEPVVPDSYVEDEMHESSSDEEDDSRPAPGSLAHILNANENHSTSDRPADHGRPTEASDGEDINVHGIGFAEQVAAQSEQPKIRFDLLDSVPRSYGDSVSCGQVLHDPPQFAPHDPGSIPQAPLSSPADSMDVCVEFFDHFPGRDFRPSSLVGASMDELMKHQRVSYLEFCRRGDHDKQFASYGYSAPCAPNSSAPLEPGRAPAATEHKKKISIADLIDGQEAAAVAGPVDVPVTSASVPTPISEAAPSGSRKRKAETMADAEAEAPAVKKLVLAPGVTIANPGVVSATPRPRRRRSTLRRVAAGVSHVAAGAVLGMVGTMAFLQSSYADALISWLE